MLSLRISMLSFVAVIVGCSSSTPTVQPVTSSTSSSSSASATPSPSPTPPTVSSTNANLLNIVPNQGLNYAGTGADGSTLTATLFAEPVASNSESLVLFTEPGTEADAFAGNMSAGIPIQLATLALPASFAQGMVTTIFPGLTETVTAVGTVPGSSACPTPVASGVTVQYAAESYSYDISYVPNCGITSVTGGGMSLTLTSIGMYPNEASQIRSRNDLASTTIHTSHGDMVVQYRQPHSPSTMPDIYDTARYGQSMADLVGHNQGANGHRFEPDATFLTRTKSYGAIGFIERELAGARSVSADSYVLANGKQLSADMYKTYACAFGVSANGEGRLEHAHNIGMIWISGVDAACSNARSYLDLRALADTAISDLTK